MTSPVRVLAVLDASRSSVAYEVISSLFGADQLVSVTGTLVADDNLLRAASLHMTREVSVTRYALVEMTVETVRQRVEMALRRSIRGKAVVEPIASRTADEVVGSAEGFDLVVVETSEPSRFYDVGAMTDVVFVRAPLGQGGVVVSAVEVGARGLEMAERVADRLGAELLSVPAEKIEATCRVRDVRLVAIGADSAVEWRGLADRSRASMLVVAPEKPMA